MKKLFLVAITILIAFAFSACTKELTYEEMLTQKKGWVVTAATSNPAYEKLNGEKVFDLYKNYFEKYELDDIYFYEKDGALKVDPKEIGEWGNQAVTTLGAWVLDYPSLTTKVPGFYDKNSDGTWTMDKVTITHLEENTLQYTYTWNATRKNTNAKDDEIYTWTFTFSKK